MTTTREEMTELMRLYTHGVIDDFAGRLRGHPPADLAETAAPVIAALDALFARLAAAEAALLEADRMREGYEAHEVVGYDIARAVHLAACLETQ